MSRLLLLALLIAHHAMAVSLPGSLSSGDIDQIVQLIGEGSVTKILRSAEPMKEFFPGIKLGVEFNLVVPENMQTFGDGTGSIPGFIPQPRFYLAKSLPWNFEIIFSFFPTQLANTIATWGGILKWTFYDEQRTFLSAAAYVGYTSIQAFNSNYKGSDIEVGVYASKDYVRFKPYAGLGLLFAHGSINPAYARSSIVDSSQSTLHPFLGAEFILPVDITAQFDLLNLSPRASISFGKAF
jgi:hypothetical protein